MAQTRTYEVSFDPSTRVHGEDNGRPYSTIRVTYRLASPPPRYTITAAGIPEGAEV